MPSPFRIDILNAAGVVQGSGPLTTVTELNDKRRLDGLGEVTFSLPAADPRNNLIGAGSSFLCYDEVDGFLGEFFYQTSTIRDRAGRSERVVTAYDALIELVRTNVGFQRSYYNEPVDQVVADLVGLVADWRYNIEAGIGNTAVTYEGDSVWSALDVLRDRWGRHLRLTTSSAVDKQLDFGSFGVDSGVVISNLEGQIQSEFAGARNSAIVQDIRVDEDGDWIVNRVIAIGAGQGEASITLEGATLGSYTVTSALNRNGTSYFYIEDAASRAQYGIRPRVVNFTGIRPLSNNQTDVQRAKEALKLAAEAYLTRHLVPKVSYDIGAVYGLRVFPRPGDLVRLIYKGSTQDTNWVDVNEQFYLLDISRRRDASGDRSASMILSTTADRRTSDQDVMVDVVKDVKVLKLYIQPYPFKDTVKDKDFIGGFPITGSSDRHKATFRLTIDDTVTDLTKVLLYFRSERFYGSTGDFVVFATSTHEYYFEPRFATYFPSGLRLIVNSVDVTATYGGPWAIGGEQVTVDALDITTLIKNAAGGMYQEHVIEIDSDERTVDNTLAGTQIHLGDAYGTIEFTAMVQGTAQAIVSI